METHAQKETPLFVVPVGAAIGGISRGDEGGGGGGGGDVGRKAGPPASRWDCKSHMNPEMAAAAGDSGFGPKCERGKCGLWTVNCDGERRTTTLRRRRLRLAHHLFSSLLYFRFLRFPQICKFGV